MIDTGATATRQTLKEWAVAIQALRDGKGMITVRKGGIREDAREFRMEHQRFAFFPSYEHQSAAQLQPAFAAKLEAVIASAPQPGILRIDTWAEVTDVIEVQDEQSVRALSDYYVFSEAYALERLQWRPKKPLHVLLLRVYSLAKAVEYPLLPSYGGCKSWIELAQEVSLSGSTPALGEEAYQRLRIEVLQRLNGRQANEH